MKRITEFKTRIITAITQMYANFIIINLNDSLGSDEFEIWFTQGLYLDLWCEQRGIYLN
jgi:hypothetical protein